MEEYMAFLIWGIMGLAFVVLGIYECCSKREKPFGFWSNAQTFAVKDVKRYNKALGKLWIVFGILFAMLGIPLLPGAAPAFIIISILGSLPLCIGAMVVYVTVIERKYREK